ncbi:MAG: type II secretion system F family protein [Alphaproteobacteria bacterium]|nr:type II secretion system F family protein [Alphaproteobacteria bacterium]MDE2337589.1 type II secretion system F family protein [Alphaproteobacteria bacterium]
MAASMVLTLVLTLVFSLLLGAVAFAVVMSQRKQRRNRAFSVITRGTRKEADGGKDMARQRADIARKLKEASGERQEKKKDRMTIRELLQQAGIEAPVSRYWTAAAAFTVVVWLLLTLLTHWPAIGRFFCAIVAFFGLPKFFLKWKAKRRQKKFLKEFADALDAMARLLQAGMPMSEAIAMTSREFQGPLKEEMLRMYENQKIGVPIGEAALMMARRVPLSEVQMFATALQIQSETGSSLSEVLYNLSGVIRARFKLRRKVQALSSEAKSSAAIIGALPVVVITGLYLARPEYVGLLFTNHTGKFMLGGCVFWMSLGVLMMRQMINFRI